MSEQQPKLHEWFHKFLINFAMWAFALMGIAYAIRDIIFATENEATYKVLVIIMAVLLIALSLFIIKVRFDLAAFRSKAPQELLIACLAAAVIVFLINLLLYLPGDRESMSRAGDAIIFILWGIVLYRYYNDRRYLFKN